MAGIETPFIEGVDKQVLDYVKAKLNNQNTSIDLKNIQHKCSICKTPRTPQNEWKLLANPQTNKSTLLEIIFPILICEKCYRQHILQETNTIFEVGIAVLPIELDNIKQQNQNNNNNINISTSSSTSGTASLNNSTSTANTATSSSSLYDSVSGMETMKVQTLHKSKSKSRSLVFTSKSPGKIKQLKSNTNTPNSNNTPTNNNRNIKPSSSSPKPPALQQPTQQQQQQQQQQQPLQSLNIKEDNENNRINKNESLQIDNQIPKKDADSNLSSTIATISSLQVPPNTAQMPKCYSVQLQKSNAYNENRKGIKRGEYDEEKCSMLQKRSNGFFKKWKYVCVVLSGHYLLVFNKADDKVPKHVYNIKGCNVDHDDKLSVKHLPNVFEVCCTEKDKKVNVYFATNNDVEDEYEWINAIRNNSK